MGNVETLSPFTVSGFVIGFEGHCHIPEHEDITNIWQTAFLEYIRDMPSFLFRWCKGRLFSLQCPSSCRGRCREENPNDFVEPPQPSLIDSWVPVYQVFDLYTMKPMHKELSYNAPGNL